MSVALAAIGEIPTATKAGRVIQLPPLARELTMPANNPAINGPNCSRTHTPALYSDSKWSGA